MLQKNNHNNWRETVIFANAKMPCEASRRDNPCLASAYYGGFSAKNSNNNDADVTGVAPFGVARRAKFSLENFDRLPSLLLLEFFNRVDSL